ncbi:MAG TPA: hypothetical protein VHE10_01030 [Candidatus Paceibacterota bacterium]|nr:hypothetical protein [Candidatus Paceibacterota bacterium]
MFEYFENLRKKPEAERRKAVVLISLAITLAIGLIWGAFLYMRISVTDFSFPSDQAAKGMPGFGRIFSDFMKNAGVIFGASDDAQATDTGVAETQ